MEKEHNLETRLKNAVEKFGGKCFKFFCPSFTGLPDRLVLLPGGRLWFVELKTTGKTRSPRQRYVTRLLQNLGFSVWLVDQGETLDLLIKKMGDRND